MKAHRGERFEIISPTLRWLKGFFVARFWHSGTEFVVFKTHGGKHESTRVRKLKSTIKHLSKGIPRFPRTKK